MKKYLHNAFCRLIKAPVAAAVAAALIMSSMAGPVYSASDSGPVKTPEKPEAVYNGTTEARAVYNNINFNDMASLPTDYWAKDAVYEAAALSIIKGYGSTAFGYNDQLTKEQALSLIYKLAGRERDAQVLAEQLDAARRQDEKKKNAVSMWADGYLRLAADEGLITQKDYADAMDDDQSGLLHAENFIRSGSAQRQEVANWIAKALKMSPVYGQQEIFNSFQDWAQADPIKIPYIEAALQKNIMSGYPGGYFRPTSPIRREEMAQILKNAETAAFPILKYEKKTGYIEGIELSVDRSGVKALFKRTVKIRTDNGKLHEILLESENDPSEPQKSEFFPGETVQTEKEAVTYKNKRLGSSTVLSEGDYIEYIVDSNKNVKFIKTIPGRGTEYMAARVDETDPSNRAVRLTRIFGLDSPDWKLEDGKTYRISDSEPSTKYSLSDNAVFHINGEEVTLDKVPPLAIVSVTVREGLITDIRTPAFEIGRENNVVSGIVEENNPDMGYLSLYDETGARNPSAYRIYYYDNPSRTEVFKNRNKASSLQEIEPGDSAFIKLNDKGDIISVSAASNYVQKYGKVLGKSADAVTVQYNDGQQQVLDMVDDLFVIRNKKVVSLENIREGDRVRLLLHITDRFTRLKEITIDESGLNVSNIYKGSFAYIDENSGNMMISRLEVLDRGQWVRSDQKAFSSLELDSSCLFYYDGKKVGRDRVNRYFRDMGAYVAVEKDYGNSEKAVFVTFRNNDDTEKTYIDTVETVAPGAGELDLRQEMLNVKFSDGTIIVKDGRIVPGGSLSSFDKVYVVANRDYNSGNFKAGIIQVAGEGPAWNNGSSYASIYRGRINGISENKDFTFETFSELKGAGWEFFNTPKTFRITYDTRILVDSGVIGVREFTAYGSNPNLNKTFYVVAGGVDAALISSAPYGTSQLKGEIYWTGQASGSTGGTGSTSGSASGSTSTGTAQSNSTQFKLRNVSIYNANTGVWDSAADADIKTLPNSIILKNGKVIKPSDLKKGDRLTVVKKDPNTSGDGFILIVE